MKKENVIINKTFSFSLTIIELYKELIKNHKYVLSKQILKSATSIGANEEEANAGQSRKILYRKCQLQPKRQEKANIG